MKQSVRGIVIIMLGIYGLGKKLDQFTYFCHQILNTDTFSVVIERGSNTFIIVKED